MVMIGSLVVAFAVLAGVVQGAFIVPPSPTKATNYQKWAHYHWVWLKNDLGNQANETALIQGYKDINVPVGALNIDSTWATQYNNFVVDTNKFPDFKGLVDDLHSQGIKVTMWATSMVNTENPDYEMCVDKKFLVRDSRGFVRPLKWWHGSGGLLDYSNPEAVEWWHAQMDKVLDAGVDGFKTDGTDPYIDEYILTGGALGYNDQPLTYRDYANMYYRDFFFYTRQKRSAGTATDAGLIMSRPVDCLLDGVSKACTPFSPYNVMYAGWVGDDDSSFLGLRACAHKVIYSAWMGYGNYGCDVGGYRGNDGTKYATHFLRSAQLNAFLPLMENGGGGEHRPWKYEESEVVPVYRKFVNQHYRLSAYLHTNGANAVDSNTSAIHPLDYKTMPDIVEYSIRAKADGMSQIKTHADSRDAMLNQHVNTRRPETRNLRRATPVSTPTSAPAPVSPLERDGRDIPIVFPNPTTLAYLLGQDILVHPITLDVDNRTAAATVRVTFPELSAVIPSTHAAQGTEWLDWWQPTNPKKAHKAGETKTMVVPIESFPVYVRKGAFIPLHPMVRTPTEEGEATEQVSTDEALDPSSRVQMDRVHFTWFAPAPGADASTPNTVQYALRESVGEGAGMVATASFKGDTITATVSAHTGALGAGFDFVGISEPSEVQVGYWPNSRCTHRYVERTQTLTVSCAQVPGGLKVTVSGVTAKL